MSIANEGGFSYFLTAGIFHQGVCLAADGHTEPGLEAMRAGLDGLRAIEGRTSIRRFAGEYAARLALAGRGAEGLDLLESEIAAMSSDRFWEAELFRVRGELLLTAGNRVEAERSFDRALSVARQQHARSFELRAATSLARLPHPGGESQRRVSLLSACYRSFTEGLGTADLAEAQRLLALSGARLAGPT